MNANHVTGEWHGLQGFVARFLKTPVQRRKAKDEQVRMVGRKGKLTVHEINVNEWTKLSELEKLELLSSFLPLKKAKRRQFL